MVRKSHAKITKYDFDIYSDKLSIEALILQGGKNNIHEVVSLYAVPLEVKESWREHMACMFTPNSRNNYLNDGPFCDIRIGTWL